MVTHPVAETVADESCVLTDLFLILIFLHFLKFWLECDRLLDIVHADQKLYLVFEFLDVDLKRYMEAGNSQGTPLSLELCQVRIVLAHHI